MSKSSSRKPSPALVISLLALFIALGGSAYAANQLAKNSVGAKQLKKNAVTAAKIKKNAVTTPKIKNEAITGAKIKESSLGAVPSATHATNATNAVNAENAKTAINATNATNATNFSKFYSSGLKKAAHGQTVTLLTVGPFTITGQCIDGGGGYSEAKTFITTNQVGSSMYSYEDSYDEADFNPGIADVELGYYANDDSPYIRWYDQYPYYTGWWAASADGQYLLHGDAVNAVNVFGSQCAFWVEATNAA
jgi:hypothetical protein